MHEDCERDRHATPQTAIYANITQTGRIRVYCSWFWVVLVGFVGGFVGGFGSFWVVPCFSNYVFIEWSLFTISNKSPGTSEIN